MCRWYYCRREPVRRSGRGKFLGGWYGGVIEGSGLWFGLWVGEWRCDVHVGVNINASKGWYISAMISS